MIKSEDYKIFKENLSTLKELSKDTSEKNNISYMTQSELKAIDFDTVKTQYANKLHLSEETASSLDAILLIHEHEVFIEFKNGNIKNEKRKIKDKIRDSLLIYCDITDKHISYTRANIVFILVYNEKKNPIPHNLKLENSVRQNAREKIAEHIIKKANEELIRFDLEKFKTLYFKEVHTYTENEFEEYLKNISSNL